MRKLILFLLLLIAVFWGGGYTFYRFANTRGNEALARHIEKKAGVKAYIGTLTLKFPFKLRLTQVSIGETSIAKIQTSLASINPLLLSVTLNEISLEGVRVNITRKKSGVTISPFLPLPVIEEVESLDSSDPKSSKKKSIFTRYHPKFKVKIDEIKVSDAQVNFTDLTTHEPVRAAIKDIVVTVKGLQYPDFPKFILSVDAVLEKLPIQKKGIINVSGWVDYARRNMDANVNVGDIYYRAFADYYSGRWDPELLGIKEAVLSAGMSFNAVDNKLLVTTKIHVDKIQYMMAEQLDSTAGRDTLKTMLAILQGEKSKPTFSVAYETTMVPFGFDLKRIRNSFYDSIKNVSYDFVGTMVGSFTGNASATGKMTVDTAVEGVKSLVDAFTGIIGAIGEAQDNGQEP
jgi:hypothetical protein